MSKKLTLLMAVLCAGSMLFAADAKNCIKNPGFEKWQGKFPSKDFSWGHLPAKVVKGKKVPAEYVKVTVKDENGKKALFYQNDAKLKEFLDEKGSIVIQNTISQFFDIPGGGTYEFSFKAKGKHAALKGHHFVMTAVGFYVGPRFNGPTRKTQYNSFKMTENMKEYKLKITVPEKTKVILLTITLRGIGEMTLIEPTFKKIN